MRRISQTSINQNETRTSFSRSLENSLLKSTTRTPRNTRTSRNEQNETIWTIIWAKVDGHLNESGRSWAKVDGHTTESGRSFGWIEVSKWTVQKCQSGRAKTGNSISLKIAESRQHLKQILNLISDLKSSWDSNKVQQTGFCKLRLFKNFYLYQFRLSIYAVRYDSLDILYMKWIISYDHFGMNFTV